MHTFAQCHSLVTLRLPNCLREIGAEVFVGLEGLGEANSSGSIRIQDAGPLGTVQIFCLEYAWSKQKAWRYPSLIWVCLDKHEAWRIPMLANNAFEARQTCTRSGFTASNQEQ